MPPNSAASLAIAHQDRHAAFVGTASDHSRDYLECSVLQPGWRWSSSIKPGADLEAGARHHHGVVAGDPTRVSTLTQAPVPEDDLAMRISRGTVTAGSARLQEAIYRGKSQPQAAVSAAL